MKEDINDFVVKIDDPKDAFNLNLSIVHQEFALCNNLSVAENIFLGNRHLINMAI